jgi:hypothetical protein
LPEVTDGNLTINGPASPAITIDGGGAVQVMQVAAGALLKLNNLTIAHGSGIGTGGIFNDGTLTVTNSTFSGNHALSQATGVIIAPAEGGAIYNNFGSPRNAVLIVTNSTFSDNFTDDKGLGGAIYNYGFATVTDSTFSGNSAGIGGAIYNHAIVTVTNSTFSGNLAVFFGGGIVTPSASTITNSTFYGNTAQAINADLFTLTIKSTIVAASSGGNNCGGGLFGHADAGYNISDDTSCGFAKTGSANNGDGVNPLLSTAGLADNGGPTQTIALGVGSPAIDAIPLVQCTDQASPPNPIITDQRLFPRPDTGGAHCDIGAYDVQDKAFIPFSTFGGGLRIDTDAGIFVLGGRFVLGTGGTIDPASQPVAFAVGNDAVRLPAGSFVPDSVGYAYQKTVNGISRYIHIKFTSAPGIYQLVALRKGGTLTTTASPVPVTLSIGNNTGTTAMNATFN